MSATATKSAKSANGQLSGLAAANPSWQGRTCNFRRDGALTRNQIRVLAALAKKDHQMTIAAIASATGKAKWPKLVRWALGNIDPDGRDPFSLVERKMVRQIVVDDESLRGGKDYVYQITASGKAALTKAK